MRNLIALLVTSVIISVKCRSQNAFSKNQFEIEQLSGFQRVLWKNHYATAPILNNTIESNFGIGLNYLHSISPNIQLQLGAFHGYQTFTLKATHLAFQNEGGSRIERSTNIDFFTQVKFGIKFLQTLNEKRNFAFTIGYGQQYYKGTQNSHYINQDQFTPYTIANTSNEISGFLFLIPEYQFKLKNENTISAKLGIHIFNESFISGVHFPGHNFPLPNQITNSFSNKKGSIVFGMAYTLSKIKTPKSCKSMNI